MRLPAVSRPGPCGLELRRYEARDEAGVAELLSSCLAIPSELAPRLWWWKHGENPFGGAPVWIALDGGRVVAVRPFLAWEFEQEGRIIRAARAVDTATHHDYRGRGLFRTLTEHALDDLEAGGVAFVFNTPNDLSRPGYLKMGWQLVGRVPVHARFRSPTSLFRATHARVPAGLESAHSNSRVGISASDVFQDPTAIERLLTGDRASLSLFTHRTVPFLSWRYGSGPIGYRAMVSERGIDDGVLFFRHRQRGAAVEASVCDIAVPGGDRRLTAALLRQLARSGLADYAVRLGSDGRGRHGYLRLPCQGPTLVWRPICQAEMPTLAAWRLCLGDIELF